MSKQFKIEVGEYIEISLLQNNSTYGRIIITENQLQELIDRLEACQEYFKKIETIETLDYGDGV